MSGTTLPRSVLRIAGDDPRGFLQGLLTQDLSAVTPESPRWAGLLTPQGKALFDMVLWAEGEAILIDVEADAAEPLARRLAMYRLRRAITIEPAAIAVRWSPEAGQGVADPRLPALGWRWLADAATAGATAEGWTAHRLRLGVAEGRAELGDGDTLWLECNARELGGVSLTKGCYVGQENTARMHHRAKVNRRLVVAPMAPEGGRARYPELGLMVDHRRIDALGDAVVPSWMADALTG